MNPIEEMMKKYEVEKKDCPKNSYGELCIEYGYCLNAPLCKIYPKFTPKKQLQAIEFLSSFDFLIQQRITPENQIKFYKASCKAYDAVAMQKTIEGTLCNFLIKNYDFFTAAQKLEIKEILEG